MSPTIARRRFSVIIASAALAQRARSVDAAGSFELATIKPSPPDHVGVQIFSPAPGRLIVLTGTVKDLIKVAFDLRDNQITGGPSWAATQAYDINAKASEPLDFAHMRPLMQSLLSDRFGLVYHRETRTASTYTLVRKNAGPNLKPVSKAGRGIGVPGPARLNGNGATIGTLALILANRLGRVVNDDTGLTGYYDFTLEWAPDDVSGVPSSGSEAGVLPGTSAGPSLFTALQEQLGLKLETGRGPVPFLVIDQLHKPSDN